MCKWEIDRFELAYFDGKKNKWQLFGECSEGDLISVEKEVYSYHRSLIQKLLEVMRKHIEEIVSSNGLKFNIKNKDDEDISTKVTIESKELNKIKGEIQTFSNAILSYIDEEGLTETSKKEIREFFEGLCSHPVDNGTDYEYPFSNKKYLFDLMSLMPIEKTWDTLGIPYLKGTEYQIDEDVNYKKISFIPREEISNGKFEKSLAVLGFGYGVELQILDNSRMDLEVVDYYDYCCGNMQNNKEIQQYIVYGCIVDCLQKAVYRRHNVHEMNIITYPIFVLNSLHYIHIYVNPCNNGKATNDLIKLKQDWLNVHNTLDWPSKRQLVKSLIEQISIFTFQDRMLYIIRHLENYNNLDLQDDECIKKMFKDNITCIFPGKDNEGDQNTQDSFLIHDDSCNIEIGYSKPPWWKEQTDIFSKYQIELVGHHQWRWWQFTVDELREILRHGIKAALSAIIVRNHSHHIGSHVMPRATAEKIRKRVMELVDFTIIKLDITKEKTKKIVTDKYPSTNAVFQIEFINVENPASTTIEALCTNNGTDVEKFIAKLIKTASESEIYSKNTSEIVDALKDKLDEYIQKKADFTAEIATEPLTTTKTMKFVDEVFGQFTTNTLLMDNIGANEGVRYKSLDNNRLKINHLRNGEMLPPLKYKSLHPKDGCCKDKKEHLEFTYTARCFCNEEIEKLCDENTEDDISIALPGCLGEYAIYAFLENFIRNGIKHNKDDIDENKEKNFEVSVDVCDIDDRGKDSEYKDEFYKLKIWDNFTKPEKDITVKDENGKDKDIPLHECLQRLISLQIVDNDGSLRKEAWGMAEMKIMATLLRGSTDFTNMAENLKVTCENKKDAKRLVYNLLIMKPKNVAIISDVETNNKNEKQKKLGIWWFNSIDELEKHVSDGISPASFKFLIIDKSNADLEVLKTTLKKIKHLLPFRIMIKAPRKDVPGSKWYSAISEDDMSEIKKDGGDGILNITWKAWMREFLKKKGCANPTLFIYFQQDKNTEPTKSWFKVNRENDEIIGLSVLANKGNGTSPISNKENLTNGRKILMYDRHFWGHSTYITDLKLKKDDIDFHEAFDKGSSDFIHIFAKYSSPEMVYELVEAALLRVLVIDERIAEVAHERSPIDGTRRKEAYGQNKRLYAARKAGVDICTHLCINDNIAPKPLHPSVNEQNPIVCVKFDITRDNGTAQKAKKIEKVDTKILYCKTIPEKDENGKCSECKGKAIKDEMDAVIIHQGVLEKFFEEELQSSEYDAFLKALQESIPYVIVDSGRGIPAKLPDTAKFLPFSLIEEFVMKDSIAKYSLTKNIMSLVRRK